ncbi:MAG TPA: LuxR C-terminal-related transcriptional regulator [Chloroflexota bacterium]|nr:LuxR C-terminal-related transcriptional regulator [Chloroflexota bacterium]
MTVSSEWIDATALGRLRAMVCQLQMSNRVGTSLSEVVKLAREVHLEPGLTIDFQATQEFGQPLVVVHGPARPVSGLAGRSLQALTPREREIASLIADGLSNKQIARHLTITVGTVKHYVHQILEKAGLQSRVMIAMAIAPEARRSTRDAQSIL